MKKKTAVLLVAIALAVVPVVWAITTTTQVNFNIAALVAYTLTLPGESAVDANLTGAPTTAIEFNTTNGTEPNVNARVVGGTLQADGTPIFQFDNTGSVNLNLSVQLNATIPSCMILFGDTDHANLTAGGAAATIATANVTVVDNITPSDSPQDWYMMTNFTNCQPSDTTVRSLRSDGISTS